MRLPLPTFSSLLRRLAVVLLMTGLGALCFAADAPPTPPAAAPKEVRGIWVVRSTLTSPEGVRRVVIHAQRHHFNTLFVQVRGRGDAYYQSALEPRAEALAGQPAEFDPLASLITQAKAAGLRVHVWINALYVWSSKKPPKSAAHLARAHPEWLAVDASGRRCRPGGAQVFVCPSNPEARAHLLAVIEDLLRRYDVDGLHLDYIRYPSANYCFCNRCLTAFAAEQGVSVETSPNRAALQHLRRQHPRAWQRYRRRQITSLVAAIRKSARSIRPQAKLSAAVIAWGRYQRNFTHSAAYARVGQDWFGWIRDGLVDAVAPMTYQKSTAAYGAWAKGVQARWPRFPVWYGVAAYRVSPKSAAYKVNAVRQVGGRGWVLFSYGAVTREGANDAYLREMDRYLDPPVIPVPPARMAALASAR